MHINFLSSHRTQEPESSVLYLVGTPIGNLSDISERAITILKNVDLIACEDTRQTKKLIHKFGIQTSVFSFNKNNSFQKIPSIINDLKGGKSIALVSDAGLPVICDPGEDLVRSAKNNDLEVICIPGPSAILTALISSGFSSSRFIFEGFLPRKKAEREHILDEISTTKITTIIFESPHRIKRLLLELKNYCGGDREILIARELTKKFEQHIGPDLNSAIEFFNNKEIIGEFTLVIKGKNKSKDKFINELLLKKELNELVNAGLSRSSAAKYLAKKEKIPKNIIYNLN
tara:strand:- start:2750 stop:3613 length:864 start_codon:yes stop_codon:yes gene_type:complete